MGREEGVGKGVRERKGSERGEREERREGKG